MHNIAFRVVRLIEAPNFQTLHQICGTKLLPDLPVDDHESAADIYRQWFTNNQVCYYGVVGVELERVQ